MCRSTTAAPKHVSHVVQRLSNMLKKVTQKLKAFNDEVEQRVIMVNALKSVGIPISNKITDQDLTCMFVKVMEIKDKPYYDGVIERLLSKHAKSKI